MGEVYASGNWHVMKGKEDEFIERWTEFLQAARKSEPGLVSASLIQETTDPSHFISESEWADEASREGWKKSAEFAKTLGAARALCDDFYSGDYVRKVTI
jgi:heme-degrading monooxygenase HmoA